MAFPTHLQPYVFNKKNLFIFSVVAFLLFAGYQSVKDNDRTWAVYKADASSSSYSPLDQINVANVSQLQLAWTFGMNDIKSGARPGSSECNPIVVDGVLYATSAKHWVYAVNAETGRQLWSFDPFDGAEGGGVSRGVTYWESGNRDGRPDRRILFTGGDQLFALDARTGKPITALGKGEKLA